MNPEKTSLQRTYILVDIIYKVGTPCALVALFFLKSQFVTKAEYANELQRLNQVETTLKLMAEQHHVNDRQDVVIHDHEQRIRNLEKRN
tara:strand:+ start:911 stop:1177 length:267 start_codon:yes stop_codon:yes gene_type:complete